MTQEEYFNFAFDICLIYNMYNQPLSSFVSDVGNLTFDDALYFYMNVFEYLYQYGSFPESQEVLDYLDAYRISVNNLDDYDKESLLFIALLGHNFQKSLFLTINMYDTTVNVLVKNYFKSVFIKLFDVSDESFLNQIRNDSGFIYMSKESYYLATNNDSLSNVVFEKDVLL